MLRPPVPPSLNPSAPSLPAPPLSPLEQPSGLEQHRGAARPSQPLSRRGTGCAGVKISQATATLSGARHKHTEENLEQAPGLKPRKWHFAWHWCQAWGVTLRSQKSTAPLHSEKHIIVPPPGITPPFGHSGKKQTSLLPKGARQTPGMANFAPAAAQHRSEPDTGPQHPALAPELHLNS